MPCPSVRSLIARISDGRTEFNGVRRGRSSADIMGVDCTYLPSRHRPRLGVGRTYQKARSFPGLTVADNLYLAIVGRQGRHRTL